MAIIVTSGTSGPRGVSETTTPREGRRRRRRRRLLEEQQQRFQSPGQAGLSAAPLDAYRPIGTTRLSEGRPAPGNRRPGLLPEPKMILQLDPRRRRPNTMFKSTTPSYANYGRQGIDTMTDSDRFGKTYAWNTKSTQAFPMTQGEIKDLIDAGLMTYGRKGDMKYDVPAVTINPMAWEQFLDDNFTYKNDRYVRKNKDLYINDTLKQVAMYGAATENPDLVKVKDDWKGGKRTRGPRSIGYNFENIPTRGEGESAKINYKEMGDQYKRDAKEMLEYQQKLPKQIDRKGGAALWNKILTGEYTRQDVENLRQYMYSPRGEYGDVQERFIESFLTGEASVDPTAIVLEESFNRVEEVAGENAERRAKENSALQREMAKTREEYFNSSIDPETKFYNLIDRILMGEGGKIPNGVIEQIMRQGVGTMTDDPLVTGGKRFNPAPMRSLSEPQKASLIDAVMQADSRGLDIPYALYPYINGLIKELESKGYAGTTEMVGEGEDEGGLLTGGPGPGTILKRFLRIEDAVKTDEWGRDVPLSTPEMLFNVSSQEVMDWADNTLGASWLASDSVEDPTLGGYALNAPKSVARFGLGFMPGLYTFASDPIETLEAGVQYYKDTYTSWDNFKKVLYEDPLMPVLDALALTSGIGLLAKGGQIASASARLGRVKRASALATAEKASRIQVRDLTRSERKAYTDAIKAYDDLSAGEKRLTSRPVPAEFVAAAGTPEEAISIITRRREEKTALDPFKRIEMEDEGIKGITGLEYASLARAAAGGDEAALIRLNALLPKGARGNNSITIPTRMDKAASFFEPRYKYVQREDGNITLVDEGLVKATKQGDPEYARFRMSGQPISRWLQEITFKAQVKGGKASPRIANIPLLGFNYRFDKAKMEGDYAVVEALRREFAMTNAYAHGLEKLKLNDIEMQVVMDDLSGGMYAPGVYRASINNRLKSDADGSDPLTADSRALLENELRMLSDEQFLTRYARTVEQLLEGQTTQARKLRQAHAIVRIMLEKQNRILTATDSPAVIEGVLRAYAPIRNAVRGLPQHIRKELDGDLERVGALNPNFHFNEQLKVFSEDLVWDNGAYRPSTASDMAYGPMSLVRTSMEYIAKNQSMRDQAGYPIVIVDEVIRGIDNEPLFVKARMLRLEGDIQPGGTLERAPFIDDKQLTLPASAFIPSENMQGVRFFTPDEAVTHVDIAVTNGLNKLYPNVRDFTDKVSDTSINGPESFATRTNRNIVVASGLMDYHFKVQIDAHRATIRRRGLEGWQQFIEDTAVPMTIRDFQKNKGSFIAVGTYRFFDNEGDARAYAQAFDEVGAVEEGVVTPVNVNGRTRWRTQMNYVDVMKEAIREQRTKRVLGHKELERKYLLPLDEIKNMDPNETIMVIPRTTYNKFASSQRGIDKLVNDTLLGKTGNIGSSLFKVMVLSMNPRFIPQNVVGSSMMVALGTPELFPQIMANMWQTAVRRSSGVPKAASRRLLERTMMSDRVPESLRVAAADAEGRMASPMTDREASIYSNHGDDFAYMTRVFSPDIEDNIYMQDRADSFLQSMGDSNLAKYSVYGGYTVVFAFEANMRVALMRAAAMEYKGFQALMRSNIAREFAKRGAPDIGFESLSRFQGAFEALRNPKSPFYDENFVNHVRYTADGVLGNYRDFTSWEKAIRNYVIPFYAWQRHSALFTKRLFQERPLTANAAFQLGNYGFEKVLEAGGIPEFMYEALPMPDALAEFLELNPERNNFLSFSPISPFSATTNATMDLGSFFLGSSRVPGAGSLLDYASPFITAFIEQQTGNSTLTGVSLSEDERGKSYGEKVLSMFSGFPAIAQIVNTFKSEYDLNQGRGRNPEDIFKNPDDPSEGLSLPEEKFTEKFSPWSKAALWNLFSPVRAISLDPEAQVNQWRKERQARGLEVPEKERSKGVERYVKHLLEWKRKREALDLWLAQNEATYPEMAEEARRQLARELRPAPEDFPMDLYRQIMGG